MNTDRLGALGTPRALTALTDLKVQLEETKKAAARIKRGPAPVIAMVTSTLTAGKRLGLTILGSNFQESARVALLPDGDEHEEVRLRARARAESYPLSNLGAAENPSFIGRGQIFAVFDFEPATAYLTAKDRLIETRRSMALTERRIDQLTKAKPAKRAKAENAVQTTEAELAKLEQDRAALHTVRTQLEPEVELRRAELTDMKFRLVVTNLDGQFDSYVLDVRP